MLSNAIQTSYKLILKTVLFCLNLNKFLKWEYCEMEINIQLHKLLDIYDMFWRHISPNLNSFLIEWINCLWIDTNNARKNYLNLLKNLLILENHIFKTCPRQLFLKFSVHILSHFISKLLLYSVKYPNIRNIYLESQCINISYKL